MPSIVHRRLPIMVFLVCLLALAFLSAPAQANTEKVIFTAPKNVDFGHVRPNLLDLHLETLSPTNLALRTALPVAFPSDQEHRGLQSWYLLQTLTQGQRYEVRLCWPATVSYAPVLATNMQALEVEGSAV